MSQYLGVDFGSTLIKVATVGPAGGRSRCVTLVDGHRHLPAAVELSGTTATDWHFGWEAYLCQHQSSDFVATGFRDRVMAPNVQLPCGGKSVEGTELTASMLTHLSLIIQGRVQDGAAVAITIPNAWPATQWSLPIALHRAGWVPAAYVREWAAVLPRYESFLRDEVIVLSLGAGSAQATLCVARDGFWQSVHTETISRVSGMALQGRIVNELSEEVIKRPEPALVPPLIKPVVMDVVAEDKAPEGKDAESIVPVAAVLPSLELFSPSDRRRRVTIDRETFQFGRSPDADWVFSDEEFPFVSYEHAVILVEADRVVIRDLDSANGTFVNGRQIAGEQTLEHDDEIWLGTRGPRLRLSLAPVDRTLDGGSAR